MSEVLDLEKHHEKAKKKKSQRNKKRPSKKYVVAGKANDSHQSHPPYLNDSYITKNK